MIVLSNSTEQTIAPGGSIIFDLMPIKTCHGAECFRMGTSSIKMCAQNALYDISFSANVGGETAAAPVQLQMSVSGDILPETLRVSTPAAIGDLNGISMQTAFRVSCCDFNRVSIVNTGENPVVVGPGSSFMVRRIA